MLPVVASHHVIQELRSAAPSEANDLVERLFALHRVEMRVLGFGSFDEDRAARERDATAVQAAFPDTEAIVGGPGKLVVLSPQGLVDDKALGQCLRAAQSVHRRPSMHFDVAARDAILALLDDATVAVRATLAMQLGVHWVEIDDRDGRFYDAWIARLADVVLQPGILRAIQQEARAYRSKPHLKRERGLDERLRDPLRAILAGADAEASDIAFEAVGALVAIGEVEPVLAYWNRPDVQQRDPHLGIRRKIATDLADFGGEPELALLRSFVADRELDPLLRRAAANALDERGELGSAEAYDREIEDALAARQESLAADPQ